MKNVSHRDVLDALDHMSDFEGPLRIEDFKVSSPTLVKIDELANYDDFSSWSEWGEGELREMDSHERRGELVGFRGEQWARLAESWKRPEQIPPIVVVEGPTETAIADGRGRVSYAIGMGWQSVPTVVLTHVSQVAE